MATFNKFNSFVQTIAEKKHNLASDSLKVMLTNVAPVATNTVYTDISGNEVANGNGYTTGGNACANPSSAQSSGVYKLIVDDPATWTASGSVGPFRYAVLYNSTATNKDLIGWWDYGASITLATGESFKADLDQVNGVLTLT